MRAKSVQKYGTSFMAALNAGALPRQVADLKKYAQGGSVNTYQGATPSRDPQKSFRGELTVGLQDGVVVDQMNTPEGEALVMKIVQRNRRQIGQAVR